MVRNPPRLPLLAATILLLSLAGCAYFAGEPVRHLASDVCLITPELTQKQVLDILGPPNHQKKSAEEGETWIYYEMKKSTLRKTPYIGERLGSQDYEVITITFIGNQVRTCAYRALKEEEFKTLGIPAPPP